jgi:hypothetical protein
LFVGVEGEVRQRIRSTDVTDVTDVTPMEGRRKKEEGRGKKEEGRGKKEEGRKS